MPLKKLRKEIDKIDHEIIKLLAKRQQAVNKIAKVKIKNSLKIFDKVRENQIAKNLDKYVKRYKLDKKHLYKIWDEVLSESKRIQTKIFKNK